MVDTALLVAIIGVGGTLAASSIGAIINLKKTKIRQENQNYRTIAQYYLDSKVNKLIELYRAVNQLGEKDGFIFLSRTNPNYSVSKEEYQEYNNKLTDVRDISSEVDVYLNETQSKILKKCLIVHLVVKDSIYEDEDGYKINWEKVEDTPYIEQHDIELDSFGLHLRLVKEMLNNELNRPLEELYEENDEEKITQEMKEYVEKTGLTMFRKDELADRFG